MNSQELEEKIGITNSFKLMNLWKRAVQVSSGNMFTTRKMPSTVDVFKQLCYHNGIAPYAKMYLKLEED